MDVIEAIEARKSIRNFTSIPVPKAALERILEIARRSPSSANTQPWDITVMTGQVLDNIKKGNLVALNSGMQPNPDLPLEPYEGIHRQRQVGLAIQLFGAMGVAREDKVRRAEWNARGIRFFDAPAAIVLALDSSLWNSHREMYAAIDIGSISQTICLAALHYGLGTCIAAQGIMFPSVVKKFASIPDSKRLVISICVGHPDYDFPTNKLTIGREPLESLVNWRGFE